MTDDATARAREIVKEWAGCDDAGLRPSSPGTYGALVSVIATALRAVEAERDEARRDADLLGEDKARLIELLDDARAGLAEVHRALIVETEAVVALTPRVAALDKALEAADAFARLEHASGCGAQCRCGAWQERNAARSEFYRHYRASRAASPTGGGG